MTQRVALVTGAMGGLAAISFAGMMQDWGLPPLVACIGTSPSRPVDAENANRPVRCGEYSPEHVVNIQMPEPFLIKAAARLFLARHQILVGDDALHAVSYAALHP